MFQELAALEAEEVILHLLVLFEVLVVLVAEVMVDNILLLELEQIQLPVLLIQAVVEVEVLKLMHLQAHT